MKRSEINASIKEMEAMIEKCGFKLPPFCHFTPEEWKEKGTEYDEIRDNMLGWDITDYGSGDFDRIGFALITLRNGNVNNPKYTKTYAEKLLYLKEGQMSPMHFHWNKMEDIINRGGGNLMVQVYNNKNEELDMETSVTVYSDSRRYLVPAGTILCLEPGQSITMQQGLYHSFWGQEGKGKVLVGEVSMCNDDVNDNRFYESTGRFPEIEEDVPAEFVLANEL